MATVSIVVLLLVVCIALIRFGMLRVWQFLVSGATGVYLDKSSWSGWIGSMLGGFFRWVGHFHI
jgi:hypothetical protein